GAVSRAAPTTAATATRSALRCPVTSTNLRCQRGTMRMPEPELRISPQTMPRPHRAPRPWSGWTGVGRTAYRPVVSGEPGKSAVILTVTGELAAGRTPDAADLSA